MEIRAVRPADAPALRQLVIELQDALHPLDPDLPPGLEVVDAYLEYLHDNVATSRGSIWVADAGTQLAGYACLFGLVDPSEPDEVARQFSWLSDLYVREQYRLDGLGAQLMQVVEERARELGAFKLELAVLSRNRGAISFYEKLGYSKRILQMSKRL